MGIESGADRKHREADRETDNLIRETRALLGEQTAKESVARTKEFIRELRPVGPARQHEVEKAARAERRDLTARNVETRGRSRR